MLEWRVVEKRSNGVRYRKFIDGKPTNSYKLELEGGDPIVDEQVAASLDDVWELESNGQITNDDYIRYHSYTVNTSRRWGATRWVSGSLPSQGDTIDVAYVELYVQTVSVDDVNGNLHFEKVASPAQFTTNNYDVTNRPRTTASASWIADDLGEGWTQTPSLVTPLQEVIDAYSPTAIVLIFRPNQDVAKSLYCKSYDNDPDLAAKLHIEYTKGVGHYTRSGTASLGLVGTGTRPIGCVRSDTSLLGLLATATRSWALTRSETALLGLKATASRIITPIRAQTALLGLKATASEAVDYAAKTGTALLGLVATGSRTIALSRSKIALLGLKATGVMSTLGHYTKEAVVYLGLAITGTRSIVLTRADTALLGLKATATKAITLTRADTALLGLKTTGNLIIPYIRTGTAYLGLKITASRGFALTRLDTALLGLKGIATRSLVLSRAQTALLGLKVTGSLPTVGRILRLVIVTTQKRQVNVITSLYRKIKVLTE